ncbi:MAG: arginine--tRNA ligase, partial [Terriglobales bacterium]
MPAPVVPDLRSHLSALFEEAIREVAPASSPPAIVLEKPRLAEHGDYACNVALQLARGLKQAPREIAARLVAALPASPYLDKVEVAGAGFINLFLKRTFKQRLVNRILEAGAGYGSGLLGQRKKVQIEFVSANPTGPLHVGHGRGAAYGASLANVLTAAGFDVTREFYINDAGRQMDILALSTWLRYLELCGEAVPFPANAYQGEYVRSMARAIHSGHGARFRHGARTFAAALAEPDEELRLDAMIEVAKRTLGANYDTLHG